MPGKNKPKTTPGTPWFVMIWTLVTLLSYMGPLLNPQLFGFAIAVLLIYPLVLIANFVLLIFYSYRAKIKSAVWVLLILLVGFPIHSKLIAISTSIAVPDKSDIKLVSFNANYGLSMVGNHEGGDNFIPLLKENKKPDIWLLQEHTPELERWLSKRIAFNNRVQRENYRTAIYTDYEVVRSGLIPFGNLENSCIWADLKIDDQRIVRVYNIHLQSNRVTDHSKKLAEDGLDWRSPDFQTFMTILRNYNSASAKRVNQVDQLLEHLKQSPYPAVIGGDINDVPISYIYRRLARGRTDSFIQSGRGFGTTYMGAIPLLRIDCVFVEKEIKVIRHDLISGPFSDHKPLVVWLRVP